MHLKNLYYVWSFLLIIFSIFFLVFSFNFILNDTRLMVEWVLLNLNSINLVYIIYLDRISTIFIFVVSLISSIVILYRRIYIGSINYQSIRFLILVLIFVLSIFLIILRPNLVRILLGWDGLGLVSYCLVIYYRSVRSYLAGLLTCLINRLGDIGLLISLGWIFRYGGFRFIFYLTHFDRYLYSLIIISSFTKRAQIPFSSWLPAAIAAPTPVSALVHSSTLVTAGVYLLIRFFNNFMFNNSIFLFIRIITMIMSSFCAIYEFDLKKIIALSTLRQLGLMISSLFIGLVDLAFFHLLSHAIFKSLLFLCAGIIIHLLRGCQDIRIIGSLCISLPLTCCCFNISNMALCGFPFLSGFYSKDLVIERSSFFGQNCVYMGLFYISLGLTSFYRIRLFYYTNIIKYNFVSISRLTEDIGLIKIRIIILSFFSIAYGCIYIWLFNLDIHFLIFPLYIKFITIILVFFGLIRGYEVSKLKLSNFMFYNKFLLFNGSIWFIYSYSYYLYKYFYIFSFNYSNQILWGEFYGGMGLSYYLVKLRNYIQIYHLSTLSAFLLRIIFWIIFII